MNGYLVTLKVTIGVGVLDGGRGGRVVQALGMDDRIVAALDALPALVAVHREVAAADRRDPHVRVDVGKPGLEVGDVALGGGRRGVAAIEQRVDHDLADALLTGKRDEGDDVSIVRMDAAGADERRRAELSPGGYGIHWPEIDEDISIEGAAARSARSAWEQVATEIQNPLG